jgi:hypothetical protein
MTRRAALLVLAACTPPRPLEHVAQPAAGVAIAIYAKPDGSPYSVVDDRRWIDVTGSTIALANIDPGAELPSLMIEPLSDPALAIGQCSRDRVADPPKADGTKPAPDRVASTVRCEVHGRAGRHLVRVLYVSTSLGYRAKHDISVKAADRAVVSSRFAIATPPWHGTADVALYDGVPGGERPPVAVAHGTVALDGTTAIVSVPPHDLPARLRRVYDGAVAPAPDAPTQDAGWAQASTPQVWLWLELANATLAPGPFHVSVELGDEGTHQVDVASDARRGDLRLPLWVDRELHGARERVTIPGDGMSLVDRFVLTVTNLGTVPREVWIEEHLRPGRRRAVTGAWPTKPALHGDTLRNKVSVKSNERERVGYTVHYEF